MRLIVFGCLYLPHHKLVLFSILCFLQKFLGLLQLAEQVLLLEQELKESVRYVIIFQLRQQDMVFLVKVLMGMMLSRYILLLKMQWKMQEKGMGLH